jgi:drug/metabolite transporter (DMT)-like permease
MINLGFSILFSSLIFVIFKLFSTYKINTFYAIVTNYFIACLVGLFFYKGEVIISDIPTKSWFLGTILLGILFILVFNLMATTAQKVGVSVASVATKMSLVIPVLFGVFWYQETLSFFQILGILLALIAVYFASIKTKDINLPKTSFLLPVLVFLGSGVIDTSIKYLQEIHVEETEYPLFSAVVFASAATIGVLSIIFKSIKTKEKIAWKDIFGGIALGIPNYFSIYYLLKALQSETLNSASVFTINNVAIVMFSTLLGIILFKEQLSLKNWIGISLAIISIVLIALF